MKATAEEQLRRIVQPEEISLGRFVRIGLGVSLDESKSIEVVANRIANLWSNEISHAMDLRSHVMGQPENGRIEIAIPVELLQPHLGITQLASLLSLPAEYNYCRSIRIEKVEFPSSILRKYRGPKFGVKGIRETFSVQDGPIVGAILKPRLANDIEACRHTAVEIARAGLDFVVDDELIVDPRGLGFDLRAGRICEALEKVNSRNGSHTGFIANVTAAPAKAKRLARAAREFGAKGVVTNAIVTGYGSLEEITQAKNSLPVFSTNIGAAMLAKCGINGHSAGVTEGVIGKLTRLAGADAIHAGVEAVDWYDSSPGTGTRSALNGSLGNIKPAFRVVAGGLDVVSLIANWPMNGEPIIFEGGGSIFSHPDGVSAGAHAFQAAREIAQRFVSADPNSKNVALAALLQLAGKEKSVEQALSQCNWTPSDAILEMARNTLKPKNRTALWGS